MNDGEDIMKPIRIATALGLLAALAVTAGCGLFKDKGAMHGKQMTMVPTPPWPSGDQIGMANAIGPGTWARCAAYLTDPNAKAYELSHLRSNTMPRRVEAVGENVTQFRPGDEVVGDAFDYGLGAFAKYACAPESAFVLKPKGTTFVDALPSRRPRERWCVRPCVLMNRCPRFLSP